VVVACQTVDEAVPPSAIAEVVATKQSFLTEPAAFKGTLLSDVLDLGAGPDAVCGRRGEQVVDQQAVGGGPGTPATHAWNDRTPISHTPGPTRSVSRQLTQPTAASSAVAATTRL